jgi:hypothetical protein
VVDSVTGLLRDAVERFASARLSLYHVASSLGAPAADSSDRLRKRNESVEISEGPEVWRVWIERPYRYRVEHYQPLDRLREIAGGNEDAYWQYFPGRGMASRLKQGQDQSSTPIPLFLGWLPPAVTEFLNPAFLLNVPESANHQLHFEPIGEVVHASRPSRVFRLVVKDWEGLVGWSETVRGADEFELVVDAEVGALLRVTSANPGKDSYLRTTYDAYEVVWDVSADGSMYELHVPPGTAVSAPEDSTGSPNSRTDN